MAKVPQENLDVTADDELPNDVLTSVSGGNPSGVPANFLH